MSGIQPTSAGDSETPDVGAIRQTRGEGQAAGLRFGLVVSRFNPALTGSLLKTAVQRLLAQGAREANIEVVWVPGAFEIPFVLEKLAAMRRFDALIALGCVIQGETPHAGLINTEVTHALADIARRHGLPVIDTVVATLNRAQAEARCGPEGRGGYAAEAAIEMANLNRRLAERAP